MKHDNEEALVRSIDAEHARIAAAQRRMLRLIADADRRKSWVDVGARDTAHWLSMHYGISYWKAQRWISTAHALESLPRVADALGSGELHIDKAVELTRFATPRTESRLLIWAGGESCGAIRRKADVATRRTGEDIVDVERRRLLTWWTFDEGRRLGLQGELPSAQGAVVAKAVDRPAGDLPVMPDEEGPGRQGRATGRCPRRAVFDGEPARGRTRSGHRDRPRTARRVVRGVRRVRDRRRARD